MTQAQTTYLPIVDKYQGRLHPKFRFFKGQNCWHSDLSSKKAQYTPPTSLESTSKLWLIKESPMDIGILIIASGVM